jgi:hypothetical protein
MVSRKTAVVEVVEGAEVIEVRFQSFGLLSSTVVPSKSP